MYVHTVSFAPNLLSVPYTEQVSVRVRYSTFIKDVSAIKIEVSNGFP
jgi:hypothetical protein